MPDDRQQNPSPSLLRRIFIGREGLRAGWSLLAFLGIAALLLFLANYTVHHLHHPQPKPAGQQSLAPAWGELLNGSIIGAILLLASWLLSRMEGRPLGAYGFGGGRKAGLAFRGAFWGFACISLMVFVLWASGHLVFEGFQLGSAGSILMYALLWGLAFLLVGLNEEYLMRGFLQFTIGRGLRGLAEALKVPAPTAGKVGFWTAALLLSFLFGLAHKGNAGETSLGLAAAGLGGLMFCFSLYRTGSLWWAMGFHTAWDWGQSFFYGTADSGMLVKGHLLGCHPAGAALWSGSSVGPEGSLLILPIFLLIGVLVLWTQPQVESYPG